jgi:hypothetical protein
VFVHAPLLIPINSAPPAVPSYTHKYSRSDQDRNRSKRKGAKRQPANQSANPPPGDASNRSIDAKAVKRGRKIVSDQREGAAKIKN